MKNGMDANVSGYASSGDSFVNRKLIRPVLNREMTRAVDGNQGRGDQQPRDFQPHGLPPVQAQKKTTPPEQTHAEDFYYQKQIQGRTPLVIVTRDGDELHGTLEWYDKHCIKMQLDGDKGTALVYKIAIKYMYKEGEASGNR